MTNEIILLIICVGVVALIIGAIIGFLLAAILTASSKADDLQEAYNYGLEEGKRIAMKDVENLYNKYKDLANVYNDNRC